MKTRMISSSFSFVLGLKNISEQDVVELVSQTSNRKTKIGKAIPPELISLVEEKKAWAVQKYDIDYTKKMNDALEVIHGWYQKYSAVIEVEIARHDEEILKQIASWEDSEDIEVLYFRNDAGDELRTKIFN